MPYGGLHHGGEAVAQKVFGPIAEDVEGFAVVPEELMGSGGTVAAVVRYTGTGKATWKALDALATTPADELLALPMLQPDQVTEPLQRQSRSTRPRGPGAQDRVFSRHVTVLL